MGKGRAGRQKLRSEKERVTENSEKGGGEQNPVGNTGAGGKRRQDGRQDRGGHTLVLQRPGFGQIPTLGSESRAGGTRLRLTVN